MAALGRRKTDGVLTGVGTLALGGIALFSSVQGDSERIDQYWALAQLDGQGNAEITEVIEWDFGGINSKRGIFRDVPGLDPTSAISVQSDSAPDDLTILNRRDDPTVLGSDTRIRIGDPDTKVRGRHRYRIDYPLDTLPSDDGARVSWNGLGDRWPVAANEIELHLVAPFELSDLNCSKGSFGTDGGCDAELVAPGHVVAMLDSIGSRKGVTISAQVGAAIERPDLPQVPGFETSDPGTGPLLPAGLATLAAGLAAAPAAWLVRRAGREQLWEGGATEAAFGSGEAGGAAEPWDAMSLNERPRASGPPPPLAADASQPPRVRLADAKELDAMAAIDFAPPPDLAPWQGGVIWAERPRNAHRVSWLVDRAHAGEVDLIGTDRLGLQVGPNGLRDHNLTAMFGGRSLVNLNKYDPTFAAGWERVLDSIGEFADNSPLWDSSADSRKTFLRIGAGVAMLLGAVIMAFGAASAAKSGSPGGLIAVAVGAMVSGAGVAALLRSWELRVRTPQGSATWIRIESFRRFLERSEAKHAEWAAEQGILREYTAWAVALDEIDHWSEAISQSPLASQADPTGYHMALMAPRLSRATSTAATKPSSSGSGGGGGGSVGGGGGGGGGGSW